MVRDKLHNDRWLQGHRLRGVMTLNVPENFFSVIVLLWNSFSGTALE